MAEAEKKILIIDDSETIRRMAKSVLEGEGYNVTVAGTGAEGLQRVQLDAPRLVISEAAMPDMDNGEMIAQLAAAQRNDNGLGVMFMSADPEATSRQAEGTVKVAEILEKPFAAKALKSKVGRFFNPPGKRGEEVAHANERLPLPPELVRTPEAHHEADTGSIPPVPAGESAESVSPAEPSVEPGSRVTPMQPSRRRLTQVQPATSLVQPHRGPGAQRVVAPAGAGANPVAASGVGPSAAGQYEIDVPAALVSGREVLVYVNREKLTGQCSISLDEESILIFTKDGEVRLVTSNNPENYADGAENPWRDELYDAAAEEQRMSGKPVFIALNQKEVRVTLAKMKRMLREQGEACVKRAFATRSARLRFKRMQHLPDFVEHFSDPTPMLQLLMVSYRITQPVANIITELPNTGVIVVPSTFFRNYRDQIQLSPEEEKLCEFVDGERAVLEAALAAGLDLQEAASIIYGFLKLGLMTIVHVPQDGTMPSWEDMLGQSAA